MRRVTSDPSMSTISAPLYATTLHILPITPSFAQSGRPRLTFMFDRSIPPMMPSFSRSVPPVTLLFDPFTPQERSTVSSLSTTKTGNNVSRTANNITAKLAHSKNSRIRNLNNSVFDNTNIIMNKSVPSNQSLMSGNTSVYFQLTSHFLSAPRTSNTINSRIIIPQDQHPSDTSKLTKLISSAIAQIFNKFATIPLDASDKQVANNYNLEMQISELRRKLVQFDMIEAFSVLQIHTAAQPLLYLNQSLSITVNLLHN